MKENDILDLIDNKSDKKTVKLIFRFFTLLFVLLIIYLVATNNTSTINKLLSIEQYAKVNRIYNNEREHNFLYVEYSDGKKMLLEYNYKIGDSISKRKGDSIEYIFRGDSILKNNLLERARKDRLIH
ncbi:hypothetical protein [Soonwooa sp.]|uniref:hypothetical protein n=1 Tax=Soonwooa sp. TaxID=1938592 RepID=UPI00261E841F|nr:hypothetical protein [Soonwooa sp.]